MSTTLHNLYGNLVQFTQRIGTRRRQRPARVTQIEHLEERALLSAASMLVIEPQVQDLNMIQQVEQAQNQDHGVADTNHGEADAPALKFNSLKHMPVAKQANAKSNAKAFNHNAFAGDWKLGVGGQPPSNSVVLHVQQFGRKVTATLEIAGQTIAVMSGKIKQGQFVAELTGTQAPTTGSFKLQKTSSNTFIGVMTINGPNPQSIGITGEK